MANRISVFASRLGGLRRCKLHGNPGTPDGRSKGGRTAVKFFKENPDFAKSVGFVIRKEITYPRRSANLAELFGVILGDGGIRNAHQLTISFNYKTDYEYALHVGSIFKKLFAVDYGISKRKAGNGADIVLGSSNLVDFLLKEGIVKGNKVKNQVAVPRWICQKFEFSVACLRGLMDTDGGLYLHHYKANGKSYEYPKLCFTNHSKPLLKFVYDCLRRLGYRVYTSDTHVSVYSVTHVREYFQSIGSSNPKHLDRFSGCFMN